MSESGERYRNNVNYMKNNAIFEPPSMKACSSTPPKQHQDFVKEHNRTPLNNQLTQSNLTIYCFLLHAIILSNTVKFMIFPNELPKDLVTNSKKLFSEIGKQWLISYKHTVYHEKQ